MIGMPKKYAVIANTGSSHWGALSAVNTLKKEFAQRRLFAEIFLVKTGDEIRFRTEKALAEKFDTVVALGGDGTVNAVAGAVMGSRASLGILPLGTFNHFARDAGIPQDLPSAMKVLAAGSVAKVDVGEVNGVKFLNNVSVGLYPKIVKSRHRQQAQGLRKWPAFAWALIEVFKKQRAQPIIITGGGAVVSYHTPILFVGNNEYVVEGAGFGARKSLAGGRLAAYGTKTNNRRELASLLLHAAFGRLRRHPKWQEFIFSQGVVALPRTFVQAAVDGETLSLKAPLHFKILPKALPVIVS